MNYVLRKIARYWIYQFPWLAKTVTRYNARIMVAVLLRFIVHVNTTEHLIGKENRVSKADKVIKQLTKEAERIDAAEFKGAEATEFEEDKALKMFLENEVEFAKHKTQISPEVRKKHVAYVLDTTRKDKAENTELYQMVLAILAEAKPGTSTEAFMATVKRLMKTDDISKFAAIALRLEANKMYSSLKTSGELSADFKRHLGRLKKDRENALKEIDKDSAKIAGQMNIFFTNAHDILKRDFLACMAFLRWIIKDENAVKKFLQDTMIPPDTGKKHIINMEELKESISTHTQTLAQGLRNIIKQVNQIETTVKKVA